MEASNSKHQAPEKLQTSISEQVACPEILRLDAWSFLGCWMLVLGAFLGSTN
jgi:hypothetical protein